MTANHGKSWMYDSFVPVVFVGWEFTKPTLRYLI